jgi:hypothetical protein
LDKNVSTGKGKQKSVGRRLSKSTPWEDSVATPLKDVCMYWYLGMTQIKMLCMIKLQSGLNSWDIAAIRLKEEGAEEDIWT